MSCLPLDMNVVVVVVGDFSLKGLVRFLFPREDTFEKRDKASNHLQGDKERGRERQRDRQKYNAGREREKKRNVRQ